MMTRPRPTRLPVRPGPTGVADVAEALRRSFAGAREAVALIPGVEAGTPGSRYSAQTAAAVRADAPLDNDDVAVIIPTSGSTGEPRGVLLSADALQWAARTGGEVLGEPGLWLTAVPVTGIGGLMTVARSVLAGHPPVAWEGVGGAAPFSAAAFTATARHTLAESAALDLPAYVSLVPTQLGRIVHDPVALAELGRFAAVLVGGAALPEWMRQSADEAGARVVETYGATETCGGVVYDGVPWPGIDVDVDPSDGRISIRGRSLALGYRLRPDLTAAAFSHGWYRTEDRGRLEGGRLHVDHRIDNIVKVGGHKVSLSAIETVVRGHPRVISAVAVAESDPEWGHVPVIYVVPDESSLTSTDFDRAALTQSLGRAVAERLGRASRPRRVEYVSDLPVGPTGKPGAPSGVA